MKYTGALDHHVGAVKCVQEFQTRAGNVVGVSINGVRAVQWGIWHMFMSTAVVGGVSNLGSTCR